MKLVVTASSASKPKEKEAEKKKSSPAPPPQPLSKNTTLSSKTENLITAKRTRSADAMLTSGTASVKVSQPPSPILESSFVVANSRKRSNPEQDFQKHISKSSSKPEKSQTLSLSQQQNAEKEEDVGSSPLGGPDDGEEEKGDEKKEKGSEGEAEVAEKKSVSDDSLSAFLAPEEYDVK